MERILVLGKNGQVGSELSRTLQNIEGVYFIGRREVDITNAQSIQQIFSTIKPNIVINAIGYNNVEAAESKSDLAYSINTTGVAYLLQEALKYNSFFISYSSDFVFDGTKGTPYIEKDNTNPLNVYGKSKLLGEQIIQKSGIKFLLFRTSSIFSTSHPCFVTKILEQYSSGKTIRVVSDIVSSPTSSKFLAEITSKIISKKGRGQDWVNEMSGLFHLSGTGFVSRYEWAKEIIKLLNLDMEIIPIKSSDLSNVALRPSFSALNSQLVQKTFHFEIPTWQKMLRESLKRI